MQAPPRNPEMEERQKRPGERRGNAKKQRRGGREKTTGTERKQEGAAGQEAQVCTRLCCPSLPTLNTALSESGWLARDGQGWCCTGFGKSFVAAPWGLPMEPSCLAQGHCAPLQAPRSLTALPMGIRCRSHPVGNASKSSVFRAINNSS